MDDLTYVKDAFTEQTGGGCMVDYIELKNGRVIGITDECVALYPSLKETSGGEDMEHFYIPQLPVIPKDITAGGCFSEHFAAEDYKIPIQDLNHDETMDLDDLYHSLEGLAMEALARTINIRFYSIVENRWVAKTLRDLVIDRVTYESGGYTE